MVGGFLCIALLSWAKCRDVLREGKEPEETAEEGKEV